MEQLEFNFDKSIPGEMIRQDETGKKDIVSLSRKQKITRAIERYNRRMLNATANNEETTEKSRAGRRE